LHHVRDLLPPAAESASDAQLLDRYLRAADEHAFAVLVARHGPMVHAACRRVLGEADQAEDVAQAVFLVLARQAGAIRRPGALPAWLYQTARRLALKHRRGESRRRLREERTRLCAPEARPADPLELLTARELLAVFDEEVERLPERYRLPLLLCCLEGRTQEEAARQLGWTRGAVKGRLERGRALLHDRLAGRGLGLSAALAALEASRATAGRLPAGFLAATLRGAATFALGASLPGGAAGKVAVIAESGVEGAGLLGRNAVLALLLLVGAVTAVSALARRGAAEPQVVGGVGPLRKAAGPAASKQPARTDRHGDPLPPGAVARLGTIRWRAVGEVQTLAVSSDNKLIATASTRGACLFGPDGKLLKRLSRTGSPSDRLAFSPDGKLLACACPVVENHRYRQVVRILEVPSGRKKHEFRAENLLQVGWSPQGEPLAFQLAKGAVLFRDLASGKEQRFEARDLPVPHLAPYTACCFSPSAKLLAVADSRSVLHLWDVSAGKKRGAVEPKGEYLHAVTISPDGKTLAALARVGDRQVAQLRDLASGKLTPVAADQKYLRAVVFSPDAKTLATVGWTEVRFHDAKTGRESKRTLGPATFATACFSPDGRTLATAGQYSGTVLLWDVASGKPRPAPEGHTNSPNRIAFAPDGKRVASSSMDGNILLWAPQTGKPLGRLHKGGWVRSCDFSADGRVVYSCTTGETVEFSDASTGRVLHTLKMEDPDRPDTRQSGLDLRLSDDRKTLLALGSYYSRTGNGGPYDELLLTGWDATSRKRLFRRRRARVAFLPVFSADLTRMAFAPEGRGKEPLGGVWGPIEVEEVTTGKRFRTFPNDGGQSWPLGFSRDGRLLAATVHVVSRPGKLAQEDYTVRVWEVETAGEVLRLPGGPNMRVAFSREGRLLAVGGQDGEVLLWDLRRGKEIRRFKGFGAEVSCLAFSPDGSLLISGLSDTSLLAWGVPGRGKPDRPTRLEADRAWEDLGGAAAKAFAARAALVRSPEQAVALCRAELKPVRAAEPKRLLRLTADLDSDEFATREKARKELEGLGERAAGALAAAVKKKPSLEAHRRLEALLDRLDRPAAEPAALRALRAVAVLEEVGSPEARKILEALAGGLAEARLTREARAALRRLGLWRVGR
jgi:RNA polymerase sigma factor (sigma-70 family)